MSLLVEANCSLYWRALSMVHQLRYINEPRHHSVQTIPCADLWVPKTLSTAEKRGFGLKKEGFSNRGTRTEWPLSKVKSSGAKLADEVLRTSRNSSAKSNDSNFRDPHRVVAERTGLPPQSKHGLVVK